MTEELQEIVDGFRSAGARIRDCEATEILLLCNRKMQVAGTRDRAGYLPLLFEDELKNHLFRKAVNGLPEQGMEGGNDGVLGMWNDPMPSAVSKRA